MIPETQRCLHCDEEKPATAFHRDRKRRSGLNPYCKKCRKEMEPDHRARCTETVVCACGCGTVLPAVRADGKPRRFALGHNHVEQPHFQRGSSNAHWKGGIATRSLYSQEYLRFRAFVLGRDEFTCRRCGFHNAEGRDLHAHHLRRWADDIAGRYDPANAVCLCVDCHRAIHGWRPRALRPTYRPCACGCGRLIRSHDAHGRERHYVSGHNRRGKRNPWVRSMLDKTPEERKAIGARISATKRSRKRN